MSALRIIVGGWLVQNAVTALMLWRGRIVDGVGGALCSLAKPVLELGEELFDPVEVGCISAGRRAGRQRHGWRGAQLFLCASQECP